MRTCARVHACVCGLEGNGADCGKEARLMDSRQVTRPIWSPACLQPGRKLTSSTNCPLLIDLPRDGFPVSSLSSFIPLSFSPSIPPFLASPLCVCVWCVCVCAYLLVHVGRCFPSRHVAVRGPPLLSLLTSHLFRGGGCCL